MGKIFTVTMPDIGEGVVEGEVIQWLKQVGEPLKQDEPVIVLMTDKATVELPSPYPGKLAKQFYKQGDIAIKGKPLYDVEVAGEEPVGPTVPPPPHPTPQQPTEPRPPVTQPEPKPDTQPSAPPAPRAAGSRALATPPVRFLAKELGIDINSLSGQGKDGRVTAEDIKRQLAGTPRHGEVPIPHLEGDEARPLQGIRRLTARHVAASKASIPHFTYCDAADVTYLSQFRDRLRPQADQQGIHLTFTPFFIRALSLTLTQFPDFNASFDAAADTLVVHKPHNIGVAMKTPLGLIVPVLKGVEEFSFEQTVKAYAELHQQALESKLKPQDMKEATITLSNFGTEGGRWATPVINAPEVAILATARIRREPVVKEDQIVIRQILNCSWSFDHRVIDGDMAAAFSNTFIELLENPLRLV